MPQALITINGSPGSDEDLPINTLVQLNNQNSGGEVSYAWSILDQPDGAVDALSSTTIQNPTLTPRKEGSYLIQLIVNFGLASEQRDQVICGVLYVKSQRRAPAAGETDEVGTDGWKTELSAWLTMIDNLRANPGFLIAQLSGALSAGAIVTPSSTATLKSGLPGQEVVPVVTSQNATTAAVLTRPLAVLISNVTGAAPVSGQLAICLRSGYVSNISIPGAAAGDTLYVSDTGTLATSAGTNSRIVGRVLAETAGVCTVFIDSGGGSGGGAAGSLQDAYDNGTDIQTTNADGLIVVYGPEPDSAGAVEPIVSNLDGGELEIIDYFPLETIPYWAELDDGGVGTQMIRAVERDGANVRLAEPVGGAFVAGPSNITFYGSQLEPAFVEVVDTEMRVGSASTYVQISESRLICTYGSQSWELTPEGFRVGMDQTILIAPENHTSGNGQDVTVRGGHPDPSATGGSLFLYAGGTEVSASYGNVEVFGQDVDISAEDNMIIAGDTITVDASVALEVLGPVLTNNIIRSAVGDRSTNVDVSLDNDTDEYLRVDTSGGNRTITFPDPAAGRDFVIKKTTTDTNTISVAAFAGETFDGNASPYALPGSAGNTKPAWTWWSDGVNWHMG